MSFNKNGVVDSQMKENHKEKPNKNQIPEIIIKTKRRLRYQMCKIFHNFCVDLYGLCDSTESVQFVIIFPLTK